MRKYEAKLVGILGAVIVHLIAGIIFMSFQIRSLKRDFSKGLAVEVEVAQVEEPEIKEKQIVLPASNIERILRGDEEMLNIARNLANKSDVKIDPAAYIDQVKEELIKDGKLGTDNYIDEQKRLKEMNSEEKLTLEDKNNEVNKEEKPKESQKMAANYKGPTRIYYDLKNRTHTYLPIPVYKCQGAGKVVLAIQVNQNGVVEEARIIESESTTTDICLIETAVSTALVSHFNADLYSPKIQAGTLTYHFVAQ